LKSANQGFKFQEKFHPKAGFDRTLSPNDSSLGLTDVPDFIMELFDPGGDRAWKSRAPDRDTT